ncbi:lipopolysaccharide biosynthesis protein [Pedobacter sp. MC2016-24]|uniref:lipopolysaccharide biosynthesis protein n=1 Tax=Pedobacter sp. MC2016-24 TaxID=2780090 RepID=UPI001881C674|nr:oligosaccharide flippase family protein [Pedobacter sp. MC2016-24]MBE9600308.1 oligosaccharide flippase family protein [Pedobacter sp. MC2016-24]
MKNENIENVNSSHQIKRGAIISYAAIIFNIVAGLIYTPWMIKQIGRSDYGLYILVTSFLSYFVMDFGLGSAIARFIAKYRSQHDDEKVNQLLGLTSRFYLYISLGIFVALLVVYAFLGQIFTELTPSELEKFYVIFCIAGFFSLLSFPFMPMDGILIAYEKFVILKFSDIISKVGVIILMVIALLLGYKLYALVAINAAIGIIIILIKLTYIHKNIPIKVQFNYKNNKLLKELFKFSLWITIIGIAQRLLINIVPTILGRYSGTEQIAIFSIGIIIEGYTWTFAHALNGLFLPKVSKMHLESNNQKEITDLMIKVGRLQLLIMGLLIIGLVTFGKEFIMLWMGKEFEPSYQIVLLLVLPGIITLTQEIASTYLFVVNEVRYRAGIFIVASIVSVIIGIVLSPSIGALGCAIGIFIATMSCHVIGMNYVYWKVLKLNIFRFFKECYLGLLMPLGLTLIIGFLINKYYPAHNLFMFAPKAIALSFIYGFLMFFFGINESEKQMFRSLLSKLPFIKQ